MYKFTDFRESFFNDRKLRMTQPKVFNDPFETAINSSTASCIWLDELKKLGVGDEEYLVTHLRQNSVIDPSISVLSLTKCPNNLLMWAHYANEHKGVVVEIDIQNEFFNSSEQGFSGKCFDIRYTNERTNVEDYLRNDLGLPPANLLKKSLEWEYEKEVRFFLTKDNVEVSKNNPEIWLSELPKSAVKSITVGIRANKWHVIQHFFKALITGVFDRETELYLSRIKDDKYEIEYIPFCNRELVCTVLDRMQAETLMIQLGIIMRQLRIICKNPIEKVREINPKYAGTLEYMINKNVG